ncbi:hypothetical protein FJ366_00260 [Candidatus Dependentiae bacterium]|nr:hypothetical protein [Candidatus Dependentiae bacterium]
MINLQIPELYDCVVVPTFFEKYFVFIFALIFFMMGVTLVLAYRAYVRYKESRKPCWVVALDRLGLLNLPSGEKHADIKRFYEDLTRILKWYCHKRFSFIFINKTDEELLESLQLFDGNLPPLGDLQEAMKTAVHVKFAGGLVPLSTIETDKQAVVRFIQLSVPIKA